MNRHQLCVRTALRLSAGLLTMISLSLSAHATCVTGQYTGFTQGSYQIQNDEWGLLNDSGGYQEVCPGSSSSGSWNSIWNWTTGSGGIKAYPSIYRGWQIGGTWSPDHGGFPALLSSNPQLPTSVAFSTRGNNQYPSSYDVFFTSSASPSGTTEPSAEMMVWLSYSGNSPNGNLKFSNVTLGNVSGTWNVYEGANTSNGVTWNVYTFVRTSQVTSFSGKLQPFTYFLDQTKGLLSGSLWVADIQFGTEIIQSNNANGGISVSSFSASAN